VYDAITRAVEPELFDCIGNYGIRFHACNLLAGGASSKSLGVSGAVAPLLVPVCQPYRASCIAIAIGTMAISMLG
jgi:hypothetical protein